jgi:hypothetical protein
MLPVIATPTAQQPAAQVSPYAGRGVIDLHHGRGRPNAHGRHDVPHLQRRRAAGAKVPGADDHFRHEALRGDPWGEFGHDRPGIAGGGAEANAARRQDGQGFPHARASRTPGISAAWSLMAARFIGSKMSKIAWTSASENSRPCFARQHRPALA